MQALMTRRWGFIKLNALRFACWPNLAIGDFHGEPFIPLVHCLSDSLWITHLLDSLFPEQSLIRKSEKASLKTV
jgi:hypothetical protein